MKETYYTVDAPPAFTKLWKIGGVLGIAGIRFLMEQFYIPTALRLNRSEYRAAASSLKMFNTYEDCVNYCIHNMVGLCRSSRTNIPDVCDKAEMAIQTYHLILMVVLDYLRYHLGRPCYIRCHQAIVPYYYYERYRSPNL